MVDTLGQMDGSPSSEQIAAWLDHLTDEEVTGRTERDWLLSAVVETREKPQVRALVRLLVALVRLVVAGTVTGHRRDTGRFRCPVAASGTAGAPFIG